MPITRARKCWWCGKPLAAVSHAVVEADGGKQHVVHKTCEADTRAYFRPVTAQPPL